MSKRPGSVKANKIEEYQAKFDKETLSKHLENKKECIYHRLAQGVEEMEQELVNKYGTKIILYLKDSNMSYHEMYRFSCRHARTIPNLPGVAASPTLSAENGLHFTWTEEELKN